MGDRNKKPMTPQESLLFYTHYPWEGWQAPFQIAPDLYYVSGNEWVSSYLLDSGEGLIIIDVPLQESLYLLTESIRQLGFDPREIKMILLSHAHLDHCGGLKALAAYSGAKIYMSREDWQFMTGRPELLTKGEYYCGAFEPDFFYADQTPITLDGLSIQTRLTAGHTPGTTSFFFTVGANDKENGYRCGLHGGVGTNTLSNDYFTHTGMPASLREQFINGLIEMEGMEIDITIPSHAEQIPFLELVKDISPDHNPFVDPCKWGNLMRSCRKAAEALI